MAKPKPVPPYCLHKQSGQAYVYANGKQNLLGPFDSPESRAKYCCIIAQWHASGNAGKARSAKRPDQAVRVTIKVMLDKFWQHAEAYYVKPDKTPADELLCFHYAVRLLLHLYGPMNAADFGPKELKALREAMIRPLEWVSAESRKKHIHTGWARTYANHQINRTKHIFKWAVAEELIPGSVHQALTAVDALRRGRTTARESDKVRPAPDAMVRQVLEHLPPPVKAMVLLEQITGARGGELCIMRGCDIDMSDEAVWLYTPATHKTAHHGHERLIPIGKRCQEIIAPFLRPNPQAYLFSPAEAEAQRRRENTEARLKSGTPMHYGNRPGTNKSEDPARPPGEKYDSNTLGRAVLRACDDAFPPPAELARGRVKTGPKRSRTETKAEWKKRLGSDKWAELQAWRKAHRFSPHRLQHSAATRIAGSHGIEAAGAMLGQRTIAATYLYAEHQNELAASVTRDIG